MKQIVWETQKWYYNISRSRDSWVIDQNNVLHSLINNPRISGPTNIFMPFCSFSGNLFKDNHIIFRKVFWLFNCEKYVEIVHKTYSM